MWPHTLRPVFSTLSLPTVLISIMEHIKSRSQWKSSHVHVPHHTHIICTINNLMAMTVMITISILLNMRWLDINQSGTKVGWKLSSAPCMSAPLKALMIITQSWHLTFITINFDDDDVDNRNLDEDVIDNSNLDDKIPIPLLLIAKEFSPPHWAKLGGTELNLVYPRWLAEKRWIPNNLSLVVFEVTVITKISEDTSQLCLTELTANCARIYFTMFQF